MNDEIPEQKVLSEEEQIASVLEHLPAEVEVEVELPSRGIPYFGAEGGPAKIRPLTFDDEKAMSTGGNNRDFNAANFLLSRCVLNIDIADVVLIDKLQLLLKIREISYGKDYKVGVVCTNCLHENTLDLQIDQLVVKRVPEDYNFLEHSVLLPTTKKEALVSTLRVRSEKLVEIKSISANLWRFIKRIGTVTDPIIIPKIVDRLPIAYIHVIVKDISLSEYGVQPHVMYKCDSCSTANKIGLPLDENFFSVS